MNTPAVKIVLYVLLSIGAAYFGIHFLKEYKRIESQPKVTMIGDPMDVDVPDYQPPTVSSPESTPPPTDDTSQPEPTAPESSEESTANITTVPSTTIGDETQTTPATEEEPRRVGFYGGGFCIFMLCLGLLAAYDISQFVGSRAVDSLYKDDDPAGAMDDAYEQAEAVWGTGDYLEAIRLMREYLAANPRQLHAALRIAEIYEKDLNNPLAAALEYEELLNKKLPRERWGWAAIHLANLYSGPLEKPDQAIALLRRLDSEYGETQAAEKARRRLDMIDGNTPS